LKVYSNILIHIINIISFLILKSKQEKIQLLLLKSINQYMYLFDKINNLKSQIIIANFNYYLKINLYILPSGCSSTIIIFLGKDAHTKHTNIEKNNTGTLGVTMIVNKSKFTLYY
jgi:hypothetical protein